MWLINFRGNFYSNRHVTLNSRQNFSYWDFRYLWFIVKQAQYQFSNSVNCKSFDEMGIYDLPSTIDYILGQTGDEKLTLVANSMGGTAPFVLLSCKPEYNEKINLIISLAPVIFISGPTRRLSRFIIMHLHAICVSWKIHPRVIFSIFKTFKFWISEDHYIFRNSQFTFQMYLIDAKVLWLPAQLAKSSQIFPKNYFLSV